MFRRTEAVILKVEAQAIRTQIVTVKYCCISGAIFKLVMHSNVTWMLISTVISGENNGWVFWWMVQYWDWCSTQHAAGNSQSLQPHLTNYTHLGSEWVSDTFLNSCSKVKGVDDASQAWKLMECCCQVVFTGNDFCRWLLMKMNSST